MKKVFHLMFALLFLMARPTLAVTTLHVTHLRCNNMENPAVIAEGTPAFGWWITSDRKNVVQSSYRIVVAESLAQLNARSSCCWDTKDVKSGNNLWITYGGTPLKEETRYYWKVRVTDQFGNASGWSQPATFRTAIHSQSCWAGANWISYKNLEDSLRIVPGIHGSGNGLVNKGIERSVVPLFRKEFACGKGISEAVLTICGLGQYEAQINGRKVGIGFLTPGWSDYDKTCYYNVFDVTPLLLKGKNALAITVGNGFYHVNRERYRKLVIAYGYPKVIAKLKITYADGTHREVVTDQSWKCTASPIEFSSIYGGEDYNALREQKGWDHPNFDDSHWNDALRATPPTGILKPETDYPVTVRKRIQPTSMTTKPDGRLLIDFGQNGSGIPEILLKGKKGSVVKLIPGELLTKEGEINQKATGAPYYFTYTLKGEGTERWHPSFSYYGFRYLMVEGVELSRSNQKRGHPELLQVSMLHTCNSSPQTGRFNCSNQLFNRIDQLIDWAIRSNLQSVVTDCPHREKLGWLEQTYLMGSALLYNYDLYALYNKMADDMRDAQTIDGLVPDIAPEYTHFLGGFRDSPEWGSAAVIVPWMLWQWYGDQRIVQKSLPMMQRYVDYLTSKSNHYILSHGLGDWFDYGPKSPGEAQLTPKSLTATALYCYDAQLLSHMLTLQGMDIQAQHYSQLADSIRQAFNDRFYDGAAKRYATGSQTAMAMPLCCGLVPEKDRSAVREQLVSSVIASDYALTAGDIGFHFLVKALADAGAAETLFRMNARDDKPGYGYQLKKGATALTESWPALEEVSNNHLMLGHLMEWFYSGIGGIAQEEGSTAFRHLLIRPSLTGDLKGADCSFQSPNGWVRNHWTFDGTQMKQTVEIPCNTDACLIFPGKMGRILDEKGKVLAVNHSRDGFLMIKTGSGKYIFTFLPE